MTTLPRRLPLGHRPPPRTRWRAATSTTTTGSGSTRRTRPFAEPSGDACDSYHRWREDLDLVAGAGLNTYRFSLEWSRIEPEEGEFSRAALDHYRRMVDGCRDRGLTPIVTLVPLHDAALVPRRRLVARPEGRRPVRPVHRARAARCSRTPGTCSRSTSPTSRPRCPCSARMAARGEQVDGPAPARPGARPTRCSAAHRRSLEVLRGAGTPPVGLALVGQEWIAEDGARGADARRTAPPSRTSSSRRPPTATSSACRSTAAPGSVPTARSPPAPELMTAGAHGVPARGARARAVTPGRRGAARHCRS